MEREKDNTVDLGLFRLTELTVMHSLADLGQLTTSVIQRVRDLLVPVLPAVTELHKGGGNPDLLKMISESVEQIDGLLRHLVAQNKLSYTEKPEADPAAVLQQIASLLELLRPNHVTVSTFIQWPRDMRVQMAPCELHQMLLSLCLDAVQAMPEGGLLQLRLTRLDSKACRIVIQDSGPLTFHEGSLTEMDGKRKAQTSNIEIYLFRRLLKQYGGELNVGRTGERGTLIDLTVPSLTSPAGDPAK